MDELECEKRADRSIVVRRRQHETNIQTEVVAVGGTLQIS
jgi:hypothetical protein